MRTSTVKVRGKRHYLLVSEGASAAAKIYYGRPRKGDGRLYFSHCLVYTLAGKRFRRTFASLPEAMAEAELVVTKIANSEAAVLDLKPADRQTYVLANTALEGMGSPLLPAVQEYAAAARLLAGKTTVLEAVRRFLATEIPDMPVKTVSEVVEELLKAKETDGLAITYIRNLKSRLRRFAKAFQYPIAEVSTRQIEDWLRNTGLKARNRNNYAGAISTTFSFAKRAGYLPNRPTAAENLARAKVTSGEVQIYTPDEIRSILKRLQAFRADLLPCVALGAFAGLRTAEIERLEWKDVRLDEGLIHIAAHKSKTGQRRLVPIQPNLAEWLLPHRLKTGLIYQQRARWRMQAMIAKVVGEPINHSGGPEAFPSVKWKRNALRHSFASYRLPLVKNAQELSLEMGNSPKIIFEHYRELVSPAQAKEYFEICP